MCYDGVKLCLSSEQTKLLKKPEFQFERSVIELTGELPEKPLTSKAYGFYTKVFAKSIRTRGSLHKLVHDGLNHSDLSYQDLAKSIDLFEKCFLSNPSKTRVHNLEFGFNIEPPFEPTIKNMKKYFIAHFDEVFHVMDTTKKPIGIYLKKDNYTVKIYSKTIQYGLNYPLIRIEMRYNQMKQVFGTHHIFLSDLLNPLIYKLCKADLLKFLHTTLINETFTNLTQNQKLFIEKARNPLTWYKQKDRRKKAKNKVRFLDLIATKATSNNKEIIIQRVLEKMQMFEQTMIKKGDNFPTRINEEFVPLFQIQNQTFFDNNKKLQNGITKKQN